MSKSDPLLDKLKPSTHKKNDEPELQHEVVFPIDNLSFYANNILHEDFFNITVSEFDTNQEPTYDEASRKFSLEELKKLPPSEKHKIFDAYLRKLESLKTGPTDLDPEIPEDLQQASQLIQAIMYFHMEVTGYDVQWAIKLWEQAASKHIYSRKKPAYTERQKYVFSCLIFLLLNRGAALEHAAKFVAFLHGKSLDSEHALKAIKATYREFAKSEKIPAPPYLALKHLGKNADLYSETDIPGLLNAYEFKKLTPNGLSKHFQENPKILEPLMELAQDYCDEFKEGYVSSSDTEYYFEEWKTYNGSPIDKLFFNPTYKKHPPTCYLQEALAENLSAYDLP